MSTVFCRTGTCLGFGIVGSAHIELRNMDREFFSEDGWKRRRVVSECRGAYQFEETKLGRGVVGAQRVSMRVAMIMIDYCRYNGLCGEGTVRASGPQTHVSKSLSCWRKTRL